MFPGLTLKPKPKSDLNQFTVVISGDTNDADYITETSCFSPAELHIYLPIIDLVGSKIKTTDYDSNSLGLDDDQLDVLSSILPYGEDGCHSLEVDSFEYIDSDGRIYNVSYDLPTFIKANPELFL